MRPIDADDLEIEMIKAKSFGELSAKGAIRKVQHAPTIDAEPVVRCKDCKWRDEHSANCERFRKGWYVQSNSYCSWGERRENG